MPLIDIFCWDLSCQILLNVESKFLPNFYNTLKLKYTILLVTESEYWFCSKCQLLCSLLLQSYVKWFLSSDSKLTDAVDLFERNYDCACHSVSCTTVYAVAISTGAIYGVRTCLITLAVSTETKCPSQWLNFVWSLKIQFVFVLVSDLTYVTNDLDLQ